jgi:hypothetical protein
VVWISVDYRQYDEQLTGSNITSLTQRLDFEHHAWISSLERSISLALYEGSLPRYALRVLRQLRVVLSMGRAIERHTLELAIMVTFIGVEESASRISVNTTTY